MRGRPSLLLVLIFGITWTGCTSKPKRVMKAPDVQLWDLPPDTKEFREPPTYPDDKPTLTAPKKDNILPSMKGGGGGGMGGGPSMGGAGAPGGRGY